MNYFNDLTYPTLYRHAGRDNIKALHELHLYHYAGVGGVMWYILDQKLRNSLQFFIS